MDHIHMPDGSKVSQENFSTMPTVLHKSRGRTCPTGPREKVHFCHLLHYPKKKKLARAQEFSPPPKSTFLLSRTHLVVTIPLTSSRGILNPGQIVWNEKKNVIYENNRTKLRPDVFNKTNFFDQFLDVVA